MNESDLKKIYTNAGYLIESVIMNPKSRITALRINGQYMYGSKGSVCVENNPERDYVRFDELEVSFIGTYKSTLPHSVTVDCCPDTNILPYLRSFAYEIVRERIDEELLKQNNKVDAERVACIETCLMKLLKRFDS